MPVAPIFFVLKFAIVGFWVIAQQMPRTVTAVPPSFEIFPPLIAVVEVMEDAVVVERVDALQAKVVWVNVKGNEFPQVL